MLESSIWKNIAMNQLGIGSTPKFFRVSITLELFYDVQLTFCCRTSVPFMSNTHLYYKNELFNGNYSINDSNMWSGVIVLCSPTLQHEKKGRCFRNCGWGKRL